MVNLFAQCVLSGQTESQCAPLEFVMDLHSGIYLKSLFNYNFGWTYLFGFYFILGVNNAGIFLLREA